MIMIIIAVVVVLILLWVISTYNKFVKLQNKVEEAFSTMDVYLKKRYDLIPNLVETITGYTCLLYTSRFPSIREKQQKRIQKRKRKRRITKRVKRLQKVRVQIKQIQKQKCSSLNRARHHLLHQVTRAVINRRMRIQSRIHRKQQAVMPVSYTHLIAEANIGRTWYDAK